MRLEKRLDVSLAPNTVKVKSTKKSQNCMNFLKFLFHCKLSIYGLQKLAG